MTALLAAHTALYDPGALVLLLSPTQRQSHELFRKALDAYRAIPTAIPIVQESALRLELANGSRIVCLPGKEETVRGFSGVRLLAVDEAARVPDALYYSVRPMLAVSGGRLVALSTPFGTRGWWYDAWGSDEPWERYQGAGRRVPPDLGGVPRGGAAIDGGVVVRPGVRLRVPRRRDPALRPRGRRTGFRRGVRAMAALIGIDVGQKRDPTAVCVTEPERRELDGRVETHFLIRHLERLPLATPYPRVAERLAAVAGAVRQKAGSEPRSTWMRPASVSRSSISSASGSARGDRWPSTSPTETGGSRRGTGGKRP